METIKKYFGSLCVMGLGFGVVFWWGRSGFAFFDMSFFIDASFRILNGQRIYTDFGSMSHGPLTYYLQALFFKIFGVSPTACLLHAGAVNAIASGIICFYFSKRLSKAWGFVLGLLTLIFFYGVLSWPWVERIGFLSAMITFLLWDRLGEKEEISFWYPAVIGVLTALSLFDKQNIAFSLTLANSFLCLIFAWRKRSISILIGYGLGCSIVAALLFGFLYWNGWENSYFEYFTRPASFSRFDRFFTLEQTLFNAPFLVLAAFATQALKQCLTEPDFSLFWRGILVAAVFCLMLINSPLNSSHPITDLPLVPLTLGLFLSLLKGQGEFPLAWKKEPLIFGAFLFFLVFGFEGGKSRLLWQYAFPPQAQFAPMKNPFFEGFQIQQPQGKEVDEGLDWLQANLKKEETFWVFPNLCFMYAALNKVSTSPILSIEAKVIQNLEVRKHDEKRYLTWLRTKPPPVVVIEKKPPHNNPAHESKLLLEEMPDLKKYLETSYHSVHTTELFEFLRLNEQ